MALSRETFLSQRVAQDDEQVVVVPPSFGYSEKTSS